MNLENSRSESLKVLMKRYEKSTRALIDYNSDVIWWMDTEGTILSANSRVFEVFGYEKGEFIQATFDRFFDEIEVGKAITSFIFARKGEPQKFDTKIRHKNGRNIELNITFVPISVGFKVVGLYGIAKDMTESKKAEMELDELNELVTNILNWITDGFVSVDQDFSITYWNKKAEQITGKLHEEVIGKSLWDVEPRFFEKTSFSKLHKAMYERAAVHYEQKISELNKWYLIHAYPSKEGLLIYFNESTGSYEVDQQIVQTTFHDALTGLPTQFLFKQQLNQITMRSGSNEEAFALMLIGLDRFTLINDSFDLDHGNSLILAVSKRLSSCLREEDVLCRFEGDKFAVLLSKRSRIETERLAQHILNQFQIPFTDNRQEIVITLSIGICFYLADGNDSETLLANVNTALHWAKKLKNVYRFYSEGMNIHSSVSLEGDLRRAIEKNQLVLYYQPQIDLHTGKLSGVEALLRWNHPRLGLIPPGQFIALAEDTGLILSIGEWVLRTACIQMKKWLDEKILEMTLSVNLSVKQFMELNFIENIQVILNETGLPPHYLCLEITESMPVDIDRSLSVLGKLRELGVEISMDDFGMGFSSLYNLKNFPLNAVKIDRSFITNCSNNQSDAAIVKAIISMAQNLDLMVVAEGVETKEQLLFLQENHCDQAQGYYFSEPVPVVEFEKKCLKIIK